MLQKEINFSRMEFQVSVDANIFLEVILLLSLEQLNLSRVLEELKKNEAIAPSEAKALFQIWSKYKCGAEKNYRNVELNCDVLNIDNMKILFENEVEMVTNQIPLE